MATIIIMLYFAFHARQFTICISTVSTMRNSNSSFSIYQGSPFCFDHPFSRNCRLCSGGPNVIEIRLPRSLVKLDFRRPTTQQRLFVLESTRACTVSFCTVRWIFFVILRAPLLFPDVTKSSALFSFSGE